MRLAFGLCLYSLLLALGAIRRHLPASFARLVWIDQGPHGVGAFDYVPEE
jgi:hypothetical protein